MTDLVLLSKDETSTSISITERSSSSSLQSLVFEQQQQQQGQDSNKNTMSDTELISLADADIPDEKLLVAARYLRQVVDTSLLTDKHYEILQLAVECEEAVADLVTEPEASAKSSEDAEYDNNNTTEEDEDDDNPWIKQGEAHGKYTTVVYYKYPKGYSSTIVCRLETAVPASLLVPLLSVLNETNLYTTWVPYWYSLGLGLKLSSQLRSLSRVNQILHLYGYCPWPFSPRQAIIESIAIDETERTGKDYYIGVHLKAVDPIAKQLQLPAETSGAVNVDFTGTFLFRPCPPNHPLVVNAAELITEPPLPENDPSSTPSNESLSSDEKKGEDNDNMTKEPMIIVSFKMTCDPHMTGVPNRIINFVLRRGLGRLWGALLWVAEQVQAGYRPEHSAAIEAKPEIYAFISDRANYMLSRLHNTTEHTNNKTTTNDDTTTTIVEQNENVTTTTSTSDVE